MDIDYYRRLLPQVKDDLAHAKLQWRETQERIAELKRQIEGLERAIAGLERLVKLHESVEADHPVMNS